MKPENDHKHTRVNKLVLLVALLILGAGWLGWQLGHSNTSSTSRPNNTNQPTTVNNANTAGVKSLVSYVLPDGWKEASCPTVSGAVYIVPAGASNIDCSANPSSPVKISVDPANNTDCNQLQSVQNVSKHICISLYINGHKSLRAETIYNQDSSYNKPTTINAYYINTGKGVVKAEYIHDPNENGYQAGFEQLAKTVQVK